MTAITPITITLSNAISSAQSTPATSASGALDKVEKSFSEVINSLNDSQLQADDLVSKLAAGEDVDLHEVIIGLEENDVNFRVTMAIRDKLVDAYREVMRMNI